MSAGEKTILFVTCINDRKMYAQCVRHILRLAVP
ncbi:glycosyltransferase family protein, partial [Bacillus paranthracis]|nr:glycosyltransferase family protein [Bacillus paranthracis]